MSDRFSAGANCYLSGNQGFILEDFVNFFPIHSIAFDIKLLPCVFHKLPALIRISALLLSSHLTIFCCSEAGDVIHVDKAANARALPLVADCCDEDPRAGLVSHDLITGQMTHFSG